MDSNTQPDADDQRRAEFQRRRLFAQAQEHFAATDYHAARQCLKEIPNSAKTPDITRLAQLVQQRVREIAEIHQEIIALRERDAVDELLGKLQRLLELQPGDERTLALRNQLEEQAYPSPPLQAEIVADPPARQEMVLNLTDIDQRILTGRQNEPDDEREIREFGEQLAASQPPPLPGRNTRSQQTPPDDDFFLPEEGSSSVQLWIALAVSGAVILFAVIVTVIVLVTQQTG